MTTTTTSQDLRNQIADIETKRVILEAERDDVSYGALVDKNKAAIKRAAEIGDELAGLGHREAMLNAALREAIKRNAEAAAAAAADRKQADLDKAQALLPDVERMAAEIDAAMKTLHEVRVAYELTWGQIKALSGAGPAAFALRSGISRPLRVGLRGLPGIEVDIVRPGSRCTLGELTAQWTQQVCHFAAQTPDQRDRVVADLETGDRLRNEQPRNPKNPKAADAA
jgi:hypothetical protein